MNKWILQLVVLCRGVMGKWGRVLGSGREEAERVEQMEFEWKK